MRTTLPTLTTFLAGSLVGSTAWACSCAPPPLGIADVARYRFEQAQSIVRGRATAVRLGNRETAADGQSYRPLVMDFVIAEAVKGSVDGNVEIQATPQFCGIGMMVLLSAVSDSDIEIQINPIDKRAGVFTTGPCDHFRLRDPRSGQFLTLPQKP